MKLRIISLVFVVFGCSGAKYDPALRPHREYVVSTLYQIEKIPYLPELSGDSLYWVLAMKGLEIVPDLIGMIDDTTVTNVPLENIPSDHTIGDIAVSVLGEILHGTFYTIEDIIKNKKGFQLDNVTGSPYVYYFDFVRNNSKENRVYLKTELYKWFIKNETNFVWVVDTTKYSKAAHDWKFNTNYYPTKGYYILK